MPASPLQLEGQGGGLNYYEQQQFSRMEASDTDYYHNPYGNSYYPGSKLLHGNVDMKRPAPLGIGLFLFVL